MRSQSRHSEGSGTCYCNCQSGAINEIGRTTQSILGSRETGTRQSMDEVFYKANISFVVSKNKAFKEVVKKTIEFCGGIYVPPSYYDL